MGCRLAIDTSNSPIALSTEVVDEKGTSIKRAWGEQSEDIATVVDKHLHELGISPPDLKEILLGIGPGRFTALRGGVAYGKALAYGLGIPVGTFSLLNVITCAYSKDHPLESNAVVVFMDGKQGSVFASAGFGLAENVQLTGLKSWCQNQVKGKREVQFILHGAWDKETEKQVRTLLKAVIENQIRGKVIYAQERPPLETVFDLPNVPRHKGSAIFEIRPNYLRPAAAEIVGPPIA